MCTFTTESHWLCGTKYHLRGTTAGETMYLNQIRTIIYFLESAYELLLLTCVTWNVPCLTVQWAGTLQMTCASIFLRGGLSNLARAPRWSWYRNWASQWSVNSMLGPGICEAKVSCDIDMKISRHTYTYIYIYINVHRYIWIYIYVCRYIWISSYSL